MPCFFAASARVVNSAQVFGAFQPFFSNSAWSYQWP